MTIDERSRHALHQRLEQVLGTDEAGTLMEHLPPVGWGDVATRRDLAMVQRDIEMLRRDLDATKTYLIGTFRSEIAQAITAQTRTLVLTNLAAVIGAAALAFGATRF